MVWRLFTYVMMLPWLLVTMVLILEARKIWIYTFRSIPKKYANVVPHIKRSILWNDLPNEESSSLDAFKITIVSSLDSYTPHTMTFLFIVLHAPCFYQFILYQWNFYICLHILNPSACISSSACVHWYDVFNALFYIIAIILSNHCLRHINVEANVLHAYIDRASR